MLRYDYLSEPTKTVLNLLKKYDIKATFFVVADIINHYPGLVNLIVKNGHEIGCHGLNHLCNLDPKTKKALINTSQFETKNKTAKNMLEKIYKKKVIGYRAPNAYFGKWMFKSLDKIGFFYDSSISANSFYNKTDMDLKNVKSIPYYPIINNYRFIEFPWPYWNIFGLKIPTSGGPMLRFFGANVILKGLKQSLKRGTTVFYFHPLDILNASFPMTRKFFWMFRGELIIKRIKYIFDNILKSGVKFKCLGDIVLNIN